MLLNSKYSVYFSKNYNFYFYRFTMNNYSIVLISVLFFSTVFAESQTCTSVTTTTCDPGENPLFSSTVPNGNAFKRGKARVKGEKREKGKTGSVGPAGTDLSEVVAEVLALLSELSGEISNVESEQKREIEALASRQNGTVKKLIALAERQSDEILRLKERVEALTSQLKIIGIFLFKKDVLRGNNC